MVFIIFIYPLNTLFIFLLNDSLPIIFNNSYIWVHTKCWEKLLVKNTGTLLQNIINVNNLLSTKINFLSNKTLAYLRWIFKCNIAMIPNINISIYMLILFWFIIYVGIYDCCICWFYIGRYLFCGTTNYNYSGKYCD